jgi:hypothetical protein
MNPTMDNILVFLTANLNELKGRFGLPVLTPTWRGARTF